MFKNVVEKRVTSSQSDFSKVMLFMLSPEEYMLITQVIVAWERILDKWFGIVMHCGKIWESTGECAKRQDWRSRKTQITVGIVDHFKFSVLYSHGKWGGGRSRIYSMELMHVFYKGSVMKKLCKINLRNRVNAGIFFRKVFLW